MWYAVFKELIESGISSYSTRHEATETFEKAMAQVINTAGDLNGGGFHFLGAVFCLYYRSLIQPLQIALGWKCRCKTFILSGTRLQMLRTHSKRLAKWLFKKMCILGLHFQMKPKHPKETKITTTKFFLA
jgi:hypothetical protein